MRTILFARVNTEKEDIISLLTGTDGQLALSDEQLRETDRHLVVRSVEEYRKKFGQDFEDNIISDTPQPDKSEKYSISAEFARSLERYGKERYEIWYAHRQDAAADTKSTVGEKERRQQEIYLGIQAFFQQTGAGQINEPAELLVSNISLQELLENPVKPAVLEKYLDTVNHKLYAAGRIDYAVLPEAEYIQNRADIRERFRGNKNTQRQPHAVSASMTNRLLTILGRYEVTLLYQYETGIETSAQAFAMKGVSSYKQAAAAYESHAYAEYISCCYPNLTAFYEGMYIGAAYVAAAMLSINAEEGSMTVFPKELYPCSTQTREDTAGEKYGCLLASETNAPGWGKLPNMIMASLRSCKSRQGRYMEIKELKKKG